MGNRCMQCDGSESETPSIPTAAASLHHHRGSGPGAAQVHNFSSIVCRPVLSTITSSPSSKPSVPPPVSYKALLKETMDRIRATRAMRRAADRAGPLGPVNFMGSHPVDSTPPVVVVLPMSPPGAAVAVLEATTTLPLGFSERTLQHSPDSRAQTASGGGSHLQWTPHGIVTENPLCIATRHRHSWKSDDESHRTSLSDGQRSSHRVSGKGRVLRERIVPDDTTTGNEPSMDLENGDGSSYDHDAFCDQHPLDADRPDGPDAFD